MRRENVGEIFEYRGYPMRSHSETRWASMMDFFGIQWLYEPRLFKTSHGVYLPDFYLPDIGAYVEVKGPFPTEDEVQKAECVQEITGCPVIFAHGKPQMEGLRLGGANLTVWAEGKRVSVSMYEISQWLEKNKGLATCARMAYAGQIQKAPCAEMVGSLVDDYLRSLMSRSEEEKDRAKQNSNLNSMVPEFVGPMTDCQYIVFGLVSHLKTKISKKEIA